MQPVDLRRGAGRGGGVLPGPGPLQLLPGPPSLLPLLQQGFQIRAGGREGGWDALMAPGELKDSGLEMFLLLLNLPPMS